LHAGGLAGHFGRENIIEAAENLFTSKVLRMILQKNDLAKLRGQYLAAN